MTWRIWVAVWVVMILVLAVFLVFRQTSAESVGIAFYAWLGGIVSTLATQGIIARFRPPTQPTSPTDAPTG